MLEQLLPLLVSVVPSLIPWVLNKWETPETRPEAWLALAEAHFSEPWAFHVYRGANQCSPREVRFAYGCRWNRLDDIKVNHANMGRVVIGGHFCYLVRDDLAVQSRSFVSDQSLLEALIADKDLSEQIGESHLSRFVIYLHVYFALRHREFFETYLGESFWEKVGIKNSVYQQAINEQGKLDVAKYENIVCGAEYSDTLEQKVVKRHRDYYLGVLKQFDCDQYNAIQPNLVFGVQNRLVEYAREESLWNLFLENEKGDIA